MSGSGGSAGSGGASVAGGGAGGTAGSAGSAPACNEVELDAPAYELTSDAAAAPEPQGGEIADGTYFLTSQVAYESSLPTLAIARTKVEVDGTVWEEVDGAPEAGGVNPDWHYTYTLSISGTTLTLERTCPSPEPARTSGFTAETDSFTIYVVDSGTTFGTVFSRQ